MYLSCVSLLALYNVFVGIDSQKGTKTGANQADLHETKMEKYQTSGFFKKKTLRSTSFEF